MIETKINDVKIIVPVLFTDERGFFMEVYRKDIFEKHGLPNNFIQDNHSGSVKGVLRGLHFQWDPPMGKLIRITQGKGFLVAVDIRKNSPTLGKWFGMVTSAEERKMMWAPAGFARGFVGLSEFTELQYKTTGLYNSQCESGIRWDDPEIGINWPNKNPILSDRDRNAQTLSEWLSTPESDYFTL